MVWLKATTFLGGRQLHTSRSLLWTCDILLAKCHGDKDVHNLFTSAVTLADLTKPIRLEKAVKESELNYVAVLGTRKHSLFG